MTSPVVPQPDVDTGRLTGVVPRRLAAQTDADDLEAVRVAAWRVNVEPIAVAWQGLGAEAAWWELSASQVIGRGRAFELAGLMASVGEQVTIGLTAAVEAALWARYRAAQQLDMTQPKNRALWTAHEMCQRTMAETSLFYLVSVGHGLANITARALALNRALHAELQRRLQTIFPVNSDDPHDWLPLSTDTTKPLRQVAAQADAGSVWESLAEPVSAIARNPVWQRVALRRSEHWHRRRPQTAGLAGANRAGPWTEVVPGRYHMTLGPEYTDGNDLAQDMSQDSQALLELLAVEMPRLHALVDGVIADLRAQSGL